MLLHSNLKGIISVCIVFVLLSGCLLKRKDDPIPDFGMTDRRGGLTESEKVENMRRGLSPMTVAKPVESYQFNPKNVIKVKDDHYGQGSGYLSQGSTVDLGVVDGESELKVLDKIRSLERELNREKAIHKKLDQKLRDLKIAKEKVEKGLADAKVQLAEYQENLKSEIESWKAKLEETEARTFVAEQRLEPLKEELLKAQITETKAKQELFNMKIKYLEAKQEE